MKENFVCCSCGFSGNAKRYARHFRSSPACRARLHEGVAQELTSGKSVADVVAEMGINRVTVYRIARAGKTGDKLFVGSSGPWGVEDIQKLLLLLAGDGSVGKISRSQMASIAKVAATEMKRLENELCSVQLELRGLRVQMQDLQREKTKVEEERNRVLQAHNGMISSGKIKDKVAQDNVRRVLAEMGW